MALENFVEKQKEELKEELETMVTKYQIGPIKPINEKKYKELIKLSEKMLKRAQNIAGLIKLPPIIHLREDYSKNPLEDVEKLKKEIKKLRLEEEREIKRNEPEKLLEFLRGERKENPYTKLHYQLAIAYNEEGLYKEADSINKAIIIWRNLKELDSKFSVKFPFLLSWNDKNKVPHNWKDILSVAIFTNKTLDHRIEFLGSRIFCEMSLVYESAYTTLAIKELETAFIKDPKRVFNISSLRKQPCNYTLLSREDTEKIDVETYYKTGDKYFAEGNYVKAIEEYRKGIFFFPQLSRASSFLITPVIPFYFAGKGISYMIKKIRGCKQN